MKNPNLAEFAKVLNAANIPPHLNPDESRFFIQVLQLIAEGQAVSFEQVQEIAKNVQMPPEAAITLANEMGERDDEGNIIGWMGLSQENHPHKIHINNLTLSAWCAWDTLFLPILLNRSFGVESICPWTEQWVRLSVCPNKVESAEPTNAVISIVAPKVSKAGLESVEEVWMTFCNQVHFFASKDAASSWLSSKNIEAQILSVEEGYQLGKLAFKDILKYV